MGVLAINQQLGSRGGELGTLVAAELGWRFLSGEQLLSATAVRFGVSDEEMRLFDIHTPHFWERVRSDSQRYMTYYRAVIMSEFAAGKIVVAGRSSAFFVEPAGVGLRVRTVAPIAARAAEYAVEAKISEAAAHRKLAALDEEIKSRAQNLFGLDSDDPLHYDAVINTARSPMPILVRGLAAMASDLDSRITDQDRSRLRDAATASEVNAALMAHPKIANAQITVFCAAGRVRIVGPGLVAPWDELVVSIARDVRGVTAVDVGAEEPAPSNVV